MSFDKKKPGKHTDFTKEEIIGYLKSLKHHIQNNNYSISRKRQKNMIFIEDYKIDTKKEKEILSSLNYKDFCYAVDNYKKEYSHEKLYIFCKQKKLDYWGSFKSLDIYIKINITKVNGDDFMYVVSFHEKEKPIKYLFG